MIFSLLESSPLIISSFSSRPINKKNIQNPEFNFPGHTEYLLKQFETPNGLMLLTGELLTVATLTGHIALKDVPSKIKKELIVEVALNLQKSLKKDFGIEIPFKEVKLNYYRF